MTGAPREAYAPRDFIIVSMAAVRALDGSWETAGCFQRIAWRAERDGYWRATMQEIADEICVSERTAKRITKRLRDLGWVTSERDNTWDSTLTWRVAFEDEAAESAKLALPAEDGKTAGQPSEGQIGTPEGASVSPSQGANEAPSQGANLALSPSSKTEETKDETETGGGSATTRDLNEGREDVDRLCAHLSQRLTDLGVRHSIGKTWRDAARLLIDLDGHPEDKIHKAIDWSLNHEFWRLNIHSMPTLRAKYDRLRLEAQQQGSIRTIGNRHQGPSDQQQQHAQALNG